MVPIALLLATVPAGAATATTTPASTTIPASTTAPAASGAARTMSVAGRVEADAGWRQDGGGPGRTGHQPVTPHLDPAAATHLETRWTAPATRPDEQVGGAVVVDGTLLRASGGPTGQIRRYDAVTGADLGPLVDVPGRRFGALAAPPGRLLVESQTVAPASAELLERHLGAYRGDGTPLWESPLPDEVSGGFTVAGDLILRAAGLTLTAIRLTDGTVAWTAPLDGESGLHPPVADAGVALQAFEVPGGTALVAVDPRTGARLWRQEVSGPQLLAVGGTVYTTGPGGVCAYTVAGGVNRWCDTATLRDPQSATADGETLMVLDAHGRAAAFGLADGAVRWHSDWGTAGAEVATSYWSPVNGGGVLHAVVYQFSIRDGVAAHRTELLALDTADGTVLNRLDLAFDALHGAEPLLLSGDHVYFAALEKLIALGYAGGMYAVRMMRPSTGPVGVR